MTETLDAPVLVLVDVDGARPTGPALELATAARTLTAGDVVTLATGPVDDDARAALAAAGATRLLEADLGGERTQAGVAADALAAAVTLVVPGAVLVTSDYRGKEVAARTAVLLDSACTGDVADLHVAGGHLRASKLVLSGSWSTTVSVAADVEHPPVVAVRPGSVEVAVGGAAPLPVEIVVVGGRGVDGDFELVHSLADPLGAAVGATRVACDEGWIGRSAQIGQTGVSIAPRLYIGLGVSGAVHHTSGIQGAGTVVAVCDDSEAPIFEMADFGVVGDVVEVVPQLVDELKRLRA